MHNALLEKNVVFTELKSTKPKNNLENCYRDEIMLLFHLDNFDALLITETWLTSAIKNGQLMLHGSNRQILNEKKCVMAVRDCIYKHHKTWNFHL